MKIDLSGRTASVTGSTAGIGRAAAEGLARAGASVIINGRTQGRVDEAMGHMRAAFPHGAISGIAADLSTAGGANAFIAQAQDTLVTDAGFDPVIVGSLDRSREFDFGCARLRHRHVGA